MNEHTFDHQLRAAFPSAAEPDTLDQKVTRALAVDSRRRTIRRRLVLSMATAAGCAFLVLAVPVAQAQVTLSKMARALDGMTQVQIIRTIVDESGNRFKAGVTSFDNGRWYWISADGSVESYFSNGKLYTLDPMIDAYIVRDRPGGPFTKGASSLRLSSMLSDEGGLAWNQRVKVDEATLNGREVTRASFRNGDLPERYVIYADPKTQLPIEAHVEALEVDSWRLRQIVSFDYQPKPSALAIVAKKPIVTAEQAESSFEKAVASKSVAEMAHKRGRLVIRSIDVARDGTVYVMYQSGQKARRTWRGFALSLSDDLGTKYIRPQIFPGGLDDAPVPKDGVFEVEVFIPVEPAPLTRPRAYTLTSRRFESGTLSRGIWAIQGGVGSWIDNGFGSEDVNAKDVLLLRKEISAPTCAVSPFYMPRIDSTSYGSETIAEMSIAGQRGKEAFETKRWVAAEKWLNEELRLNRKVERLGYGTWSQAGARKMLSEIPKDQAPQ